MCSEPIWDVGEVLANSRHQRVFRLLNRGSDELTIRHVQADCGCLATTPAKKSVAPGEAFEIQADFTAQPIAGPLQHRITVATEAPHEHRVDLFVRGTILPNPGLYSPTPDLDFGRIEGTEPAHRTLVVARYDRSPVNFKEFTSDEDAIRLDGEVKPIATLAGGVAIPLAIDPEKLPLGRSRLLAKVITDHSKEFAEFPVRITVTRVPDGPFVESVSVIGLRPSSPQRASIVQPGATVRSEIADVRFKGDEQITTALVRTEDGKPSGEVEFSFSRDAEPPITPQLVEGTLEVSLGSRGEVWRIPTRVLTLKATELRGVRDAGQDNP